MTKMTRQQKRQKMREDAKKQFSQEKPSPISEDKSEKCLKYIDNILREISSIKSNIKVLDERLCTLVETLEIKKVTSWEDISKVETLFAQLKTKKSARIKELLKEDFTVEQYLGTIEEDSKTPNHLKLNIHPIKDLNLNPNEVGAVFLELNPDYGEEECKKVAKIWNMELVNFGFKK